MKPAVMDMCATSASLACQSVPESQKTGSTHNSRRLRLLVCHFCKLGQARHETRRCWVEEGDIALERICRKLTEGFKRRHVQTCPDRTAGSFRKVCVTGPSLQGMTRFLGSKGSNRVCSGSIGNSSETHAPQKHSCSCCSLCFCCWLVVARLVRVQSSVSLASCSIHNKTTCQSFRGVATVATVYKTISSEARLLQGVRSRAQVVAAWQHLHTASEAEGFRRCAAV